MSFYNKLMLAPSLLAADFTRLGEQVQEAAAAGADMFHVDIMDGRFVPNISMGPLVVQAVRRVTTLPLDVHLMIVEPERYIPAFAAAGASSISVHLEACPHLHRTLQMIRDEGCRAGVAINPHSPALLLHEVIGMLDIINVMTVNPGFGGQVFLPETMSKIAQLRAMAGDRHMPVDIEVDGGINQETVASAVQAGANVLVIGTAIFQHPQGIAAGIRDIRSTLDASLIG
ncbi:MAG: ribulose-phosphate 3-epimerase [Anaerolineae bacterium]|jgi:ribulose-phosphate 3-epimerase|nr:ribulose-phosphate 3-epimerase [Anaerolineae bacterium]